MDHGKDRVMTLKIVGAILIIVGCGGVGFSMCQYYRREERAMGALLQGLDWMVLELNYRMPPLSTLCMEASKVSEGPVGCVLKNLAFELEHQITPDVSTCMEAAILATDKVPDIVKKHLRTLGTSLGVFDLQGQLAALEGVAALCKRDLEHMSRGKDVRLRNYQTLGLCAGAALVILFI